MNGIAAAFSATGLYYLGFAFFKVAAGRMAPLRGNRIPHMTWTIVSNWIFLIGLAFVLGGLGLQITALRDLPLSTAVPIFMSGMVPLLLIALVFFGERLTAREWLSLLLIGGAILLLTASLGGDEPIGRADVALWKLAVVVAPAIVVPVLILMLGDHRPDGRHARPVTGIAYGLGTGFPVGTAELAIKGWSDHADAGRPEIAMTPWPYLTVFAAAIGFGIMVMAFQRCRVSIVSTVMTVTAKSYLLTMGTFLYAEPWPRDLAHSGMRLGALALGVVAIGQFPRHRPVADEPRDPSYRVAKAGSSARDPLGSPRLGDPALGDPAFGEAAFGEAAFREAPFGGERAGRASRQVPLAAPVPQPRSPHEREILGEEADDRPEPATPRRPVRPQAPAHTEIGADGRWRGFSD
ncbi:DMT family transporter [Spirillospora sp. NBC_00431]